MAVNASLVLASTMHAQYAMRPQTIRVIPWLVIPLVALKFVCSMKTLAITTVKSFLILMSHA